MIWRYRKEILFFVIYLLTLYFSYEHFFSMQTEQIQAFVSQEQSLPETDLELLKAEKSRRLQWASLNPKFKASLKEQYSVLKSPVQQWPEEEKEYYFKESLSSRSESFNRDAPDFMRRFFLEEENVSHQRFSVPDWDITHLRERLDILEYNGNEERFYFQFPSGIEYYVALRQKYGRKLHEITAVRAERLFHQRMEWLIIEAISLLILCWVLYRFHIAFQQGLHLYGFLGLVLTILIFGYFSALYVESQQYVEKQKAFNQRAREIALLKSSRQNLSLPSYDLVRAVLPAEEGSVETLRSQGGFWILYFQSDSVKAILQEKLGSDIPWIMWLCWVLVALSQVVASKIDGVVWQRMTAFVEDVRKEKMSSLGSFVPGWEPQLTQELIQAREYFRKREEELRFLSRETAQELSEMFQIEIGRQTVTVNTIVLFCYPANLKDLEPLSARDSFRIYNRYLDFLRECAGRFGGVAVFGEDWSQGVVFPGYSGMDVSLQRSFLCGLYLMKELEEICNFPFCSFVTGGDLSLRLTASAQRQEIFMGGELILSLRSFQRQGYSEPGLYSVKRYSKSSQVDLFQQEELEEAYFRVKGILHLKEHLELLSVSSSDFQEIALDLAGLEPEEWMIVRILEHIPSMLGELQRKAMDSVVDYCRHTNSGLSLLPEYICRWLKEEHAELAVELLSCLRTKNITVTDSFLNELEQSSGDEIKEQLLLLRLSQLHGKPSPRLIQELESSTEAVGIRWAGYQFSQLGDPKGLELLFHHLLKGEGSSREEVWNQYRHLLEHQEGRRKAFIQWLNANESAFLKEVRQELNHQERWRQFLILPVISHLSLNQLFEELVIKHKKCPDPDMKIEILGVLKRLGADAFLVYALK
jgi:hypothetical protein